MHKIVCKILGLFLGFVLFGVLVFTDVTRPSEAFYLTYFPIDTFYCFENNCYVQVELRQDHRIDTEIPYYYGELSDKAAAFVFEDPSLQVYCGRRLGCMDGDFVYGSHPDVYEVLLPGEQHAAEDLLLMKIYEEYRLAAKIEHPYSEKMRDVTQWEAFSKEFALQFDFEFARHPSGGKWGHPAVHTQTALLDSPYYNYQDTQNPSYQAYRKARMTLIYMGRYALHFITFGLVEA